MRANIVMVVVGKRKTGKTSFIKKEILTPSILPKKLIIDTFDSDTWHTLETWDQPELRNIPIPVITEEDLPRWKSGTYRIYSSHPLRLAKKIFPILRNTLVIVEDASKWLEGKLDDDTKALLFDSKQKNVDLCFVFHEYATIPPRIIKNADVLVAFKTGDGALPRSKYAKDGVIDVAFKKIQQASSFHEHLILSLN